MKFPEWDIIAWVAIIAVGGVFELLGVFDTKFATFTALMRSWIPLWVRATICGLLTYHFVIDPRNWIDIVKKLLNGNS